MLNKYATIFLAFSLFAAGTYLSAQVHDHHDHGAPVTAAPDGERPKVFLDKNRRIVDYQLSRLDNSRLLLVERHADDVKYEPVYAAILTRAAMSPQYREEALQGLVQ
ncbi:MAG: hypothetical protein KDA60_09365, partial [Planctomycetales bacterium]|nr:hypothetical protein [Planctomycetales bacterium]